MLNKKNHILSAIALSFLLFSTPQIQAQENITDASSYEASSLTDYSYEIYPETEQMILEAIKLDPGNKEYVTNIINLFQDYIKGTSEELNLLLQEALLEAEKVTIATNKEIEEWQKSS